MKRALSLWGPPLLWAICIFSLSAQSTLPRVPEFIAWDKLQHSFAYAVGGFLIARALGARPHAAALAAALGCIFGVSDEVHQAFVPGRNSDVLVWVADSVGVLAGIGIHHFITTLRAQRTRAAGATGS